MEGPMHNHLALALFALFTSLALGSGCNQTAAIGAKIKAAISRVPGTRAGSATHVKVTPKSAPQMAMKVEIPKDGKVEVKLPKAGDKATLELVKDNMTLGPVTFPKSMMTTAETDEFNVPAAEPMSKTEQEIDFGTVEDDAGGLDSFDSSNDPLDQVDTDGDGMTDFYDGDLDGDGAPNESDETIEF
jgi:hypothetical protein